MNCPEKQVSPERLREVENDLAEALICGALFEITMALSNNNVDAFIARVSAVVGHA